MVTFATSARVLEQRRSIIVLGVLAILIGASYLRLEGLSRDSVWHDEAHSALVARQAAADVIRTSAVEDNNPPLYYLLLHYWTALARSDDEAALRTLSTLFGVAGVLAVFTAGRYLGGTGAGLWSAALLGGCVFHVQYSREARMYSLLFLLGTVSTYSFLRLSDGGKWRNATWIATTAAMLMSHTAAVFTLFAQHVCWAFLWIYSRRSAQALAPSPRRWLAMNAVVALAIAPWIVVVARQYQRLDDVFWIPPPYLSAPLDILIGLAGSRLAFAAAAAAAFAGTLWLVSRSTAAGGATRLPPQVILGVLAIWGAVPILAPWAWSYVGVPILVPRISIVALAPLTIAAAFGIRAIRPRWASAMAGTLLVLLFAGQAWTYTHRLTKEDWRRTAAEIEAGARPGDLLLFHEAARRKGIDYYLRQPVADVAGFPQRRFRAGETVQANELEALPAIVEPYDRVWLILANSRDPQRLIEGALAKEFVRVQSRAYRQITLHLFARRD